MPYKKPLRCSGLMMAGSQASSACFQPMWDLSKHSEGQAAYPVHHECARTKPHAPEHVLLNLLGTGPEVSFEDTRRLFERAGSSTARLRWDTAPRENCSALILAVTQQVEKFHSVELG